MRSERESVAGGSTPAGRNRPAGVDPTPAGRDDPTGVDPAPSGAGVGWLLLIYRVPSEPTRLRATVWRRLRGLGAVYLQNSAAALPASPAAERALRKLRHDIVDMAGSAILLQCQALVGENEVIAAFQAARNDEYEEIVDRCQDFLAQVEKEYLAEHFTYAELEENDVDLTKLKSWYEKVLSRDAFGAAGRDAVVSALARCEKALEDYGAEVYAREADAQ